MALVFVVDDSPLQVLTLEKMLSEEGYQVCTFSDGYDLMHQLQSQKPELIISDIEMPGIDGFELLKMIRDRSDVQNIPFFLISSRVDDITVQKASREGADMFIGKPLNHTDFSQTIRKHLPLN